MSTTVTTTTTAAAPAVDAKAAPVKAKRRTGVSKKKAAEAAAAAAATVAKEAPATAIAAPVTKPKVPRVTALSLFAAERKPILREQHKEDKKAAIVTRMMEEWKALDGDKRAEYEKTAAAIKREREAAEKAAAAAAAAAVALASASASDASAGDKKKSKKKRKAKDCVDGEGKKTRVDNGIKRSMSPYMFFTASYPFKKKDADAAAAAPKEGEPAKTEQKQSGQRMGDEWNHMTAEQKQPFVDLAETDKLRYRREKTEWEAKNPKPAKVQKRAHSAYIIYTQKNRANIKLQNPGISFKDQGIKLGEGWELIKEVPDKRREFDDERARQVEFFANKKKEAEAAKAAAVVVPASA